MGSKASLLLQDQEIDEIQRETGFSKSQIVRLYSRFTCLDTGNKGFLTREDFLRIPELAINPLGERIIHAFLNYDNQGVNFKKFMKTLAIFRPITNNKSVTKGLTSVVTDAETLNTREAKLKFAFEMFDLGHDNFIQQEELLAILHMMVGTNITEEQLHSIVDRALAEADFDNDGKIGWTDFQKVMDHVDVENKMAIRFLH